MVGVFSYFLVIEKINEARLMMTKVYANISR